MLISSVDTQLQPVGVTIWIAVKRPLSAWTWSVTLPTAQLYTYHFAQNTRNCARFHSEKEVTDYYWESEKSHGQFMAKDDSAALEKFHAMILPKKGDRKWVLYKEGEEKMIVLWELPK